MYEDFFHRLELASNLAKETVRELSLDRPEDIPRLEERIIESATIIHPPRKINPYTRYRNVNVSPGLGGIPFTPPEDIPHEMNAYLSDLIRIPSLPLKGIFTHFHLVRIHPFEDGNGRLARVWQNAFLGKAGFPPFTIFPIKEEVITAANGYLSPSIVRRAREEYRHLMADTRKLYQKGNQYYLMPLVEFTFQRLEEIVSLLLGEPQRTLTFLQKHSRIRS